MDTSEKTNLHYTRGNTPKLVTSGEVHLCNLAPGQHSSKETSLRWRWRHCVRIDKLENRTQTSRTDVFNYYANWPVEKDISTIQDVIETMRGKETKCMTHAKQ